MAKTVKGTWHIWQVVCTDFCNCNMCVDRLCVRSGRTRATSMFSMNTAETHVLWLTWSMEWIALRMTPTCGWHRSPLADHTMSTCSLNSMSTSPYSESGFVPWDFHHSKSSYVDTLWRFPFSCQELPFLKFWKHKIISHVDTELCRCFSFFGMMILYGI